ncbi:MAG TPA: 3'-5' exonuclease [Ktedonobacteraceae bacterium]|nr:3'-5' exonuclease [Ktedonobacteraceae bacterium]
MASVRTTCWEKGMRPEDEEHEVIEVGTCILDVATLEISQKQRVILRPYRSKISDFCTLLTTLTQEQVEAEGIAFPQLCLQLRHHKMHEYAWASFGEDQRLFIERECLVRQAPYPLNALHLNVRLLATCHLQLTQAPSVARTLQLLRLPPQEGRRAGDAAWSVARILAFFLSRLRCSAEATDPEPPAEQSQVE